MKGRIADIFESIQGEGIYMGERQLFVRFFGCNLTCKFCDTRLSSFTEYDPEELLGKIKLYNNGWRSVSFTGGEPLMQRDFLYQMLKLTRSEGYKNYLETNGILFDDLEHVIDYVDIVAMDFKLSSSTGSYSFWRQHRRFLEVASQKETFIKMVICHSTEDADIWRAVKVVKEVNPYLVLVLQPNSLEYDTVLKEKMERFRNISIDYGIVTCIILQIHKMLRLK